MEIFLRLYTHNIVVEELSETSNFLEKTHRLDLDKIKTAKKSRTKLNIGGF
jgi:hypothetical protein